eukprot:scaffold14156_cov56-Phaeocystis_antarctica.AAC.2
MAIPSSGHQCGVAQLALQVHVGRRLQQRSHDGGMAMPRGPHQSGESGLATAAQVHASRGLQQCKHDGSMAVPSSPHQSGAASIA